MDREVAEEQYVVNVLTTWMEVVAYSPADTLAARAKGAAMSE